jgi:hypothetical protein
MDRFVPRDDGSNVTASAARQSMSPQTSSHLERRLDAHLLQRIELGQQLWVLRVVGQALGGSSHGAGIVAHVTQHANHTSRKVRLGTAADRTSVIF